MCRVTKAGEIVSEELGMNSSHQARLRQVYEYEPVGKKWLRRVAIVAISCLMPTVASAAMREYRMSFEPSPSPEAVGYTLHIGPAAEDYATEFDLGSPPVAGGTVVYAIDLEDSLDLFVALRAYDTNGTRSAYSNEIRVSAVPAPPPADPLPPAPVPEPEPEPDPEPEPPTTPDPDPEPPTTPEPSPPPDTGSGPEVRDEQLFFDDFDSYASGQDPNPWLDTARGNSMLEAETLFEVMPAPGGGMAYGTTLQQTNIHSHFATAESANWWNYEYSGRMRFSDKRAGVGVTILSDYPNSDSYLRLRRWHGKKRFSLSSHPYQKGVACDGETETGVESSANIWYAFRFRTEDTNDGTHVRAKVWAQSDPEPGDWQIDCLWTAWESPVGRPGLWSMGPGQKLWDDLGASDLLHANIGPDSDATPPTGDPVGSDPAESRSLYAENFDALLHASDPIGWVDTSPHNSSLIDPALFDITDAPGGGSAFSTRSTSTNVHSHYLGSVEEARNWKDYETSGRMRFTSSEGGIGFTLHSAYPENDRYLRVRRYADRPDFHVAIHSSGDTSCSGSTTTGFSSRENIWYNYRARTFGDAGLVRLQARIWAEGEPEPTDWRLDCVPADQEGFRQGGAPGVWSMGQGEKFWDDLVVESLAPTQP